MSKSRDADVRHCLRDKSRATARLPQGVHARDRRAFELGCERVGRRYVRSVSKVHSTSCRGYNSRRRRVSSPERAIEGSLDGFPRIRRQLGLSRHRHRLGLGPRSRQSWKPVTRIRSGRRSRLGSSCASTLPSIFAPKTAVPIREAIRSMAGHACILTSTFRSKGGLQLLLGDMPGQAETTRPQVALYAHLKVQPSFSSCRSRCPPTGTARCMTVFDDLRRSSACSRSWSSKR